MRGVKKILLIFLAVPAVLFLFVTSGMLLVQGDSGTVEAVACQNQLQATPTAITLTDLTLTSDQLHYASLIAGIAINRGLSEKDAMIGLITAMQESSLSNVTVAVDYDSLGLFQQRPSILNDDGTPYWGTPEQLVDPVYATNRFFDELVKLIPDRTKVKPAVAAQTVQNSKYPRAYEKWIDLGTRLAAQAYQQAGGASPTGTQVFNCEQAPAPAVASAIIEDVISHAESQLGVRYAWGEETPKAGFDCSGLMMWAFGQEGIDLDRTSRQQYHNGTKITDRKEIRRGDLVFWAYDTSDSDTIHHVALYLGNDLIIEAPYTGSFVRTVPMRWGGEYIGGTRVVP